MLTLALLACFTRPPAELSKDATPGEGHDSGGTDSDAIDTAEDPEDSGDSRNTELLSPSVNIRSPADGAEVENPVTFEVVVDDVAYAVLDADGYELARVEDMGKSSVEYSFSGTGYPRVITLTGYDQSGNATTTESITIEVRAEGVSLDVPYFYQYDNANEPGSTCGVTSAAMLVDYWNPGSVTPDSLYRAYGKAQGQSPDALAALYRSEGLYSDYTYGGTRAEIRAHLDAGRPVVVHGYWTGAGHVTVIVGYTDTDWIVNDPAGDWYTCYGCGEADHIEYPIGGGWDDEMSWDGDVWYSTAGDKAF
ncbi:MAG: C39 family peptidase [Deltaproteobacteria bacterium]|nr:C39 family peptidase [Deltaproteobacteria bacterium]